jgi:hypothetical protein
MWEIEMTKEITVSKNIEVSEFRRGEWIIFASTEHEDGRYLGFTRGFGSKENTLKVAREWAKLSVAQLRDICNA